jgi:hypothetical protein
MNEWIHAYPIDSVFLENSDWYTSSVISITEMPASGRRCC